MGVYGAIRRTSLLTTDVAAAILVAVMVAAPKLSPGQAASNRRWKALNPKKFRVEKWTAKAVKLGKIKKQPCEACGATKVVAHHDDYNQRARVRWLCHSHHNVWHMKNGEGANAHTPDPFVRPRKGASPFHGVSRARNKWAAEIFVARKRVWSATFSNERDAADARDAEVRRRGLGLPINFPKKTEAA